MADKSRIEDILEATIDGTAYEEPAGSRIEELLLELKEVIEEGGDGYTKQEVNALLAGKLNVSDTVVCTQAEYDALPQKTARFYFIKEAM